MVGNNRASSTPVGGLKAIEQDSAREGQTLGAAFWLLIVYYCFEYGRAHQFVPLLAGIKAPFFTSLALIAMWFFRGERHIIQDRLILLYVAFIALCGVTVLFAVNTYHAYSKTSTLLMYLVVGVLPYVMIVKSERRLRAFFDIWIILHVFLAVLAISGNGKGAGSFLGDENDLAVALNMAIPYAFFMTKMSGCGGARKKWYWIGSFVLALGVVATQSRGGFLGLVAVALITVFYSKRRLINFVAIAALGVALVILMPQAYVKEINTITDNRDSTRNDRIYMWKRGWEMFIDNPILGVGAGNYPWRVGEYEVRSGEYDPESMRSKAGRPSHSLYFTLLPELGLIGVVLYGGLVITVVGRLRRITRMREGDGPTQTLARATLVSILSMFVPAAFVSVLYYPFFWYGLGFALAIDKISNLNGVRHRENTAYDRDDGSRWRGAGNGRYRNTARWRL